MIQTTAGWKKTVIERVYLTADRQAVARSQREQHLGYDRVIGNHIADLIGLTYEAGMMLIQLKVVTPSPTSLARVTVRRYEPAGNGPTVGCMRWPVVPGANGGS